MVGQMEQPMVSAIAMASQLAHNSLRFGWYSLLHRLMEEQTNRTGPLRARYRPVRPVPSRKEILASLRLLLLEDARLVRDGLAPPGSGDGDGFVSHVSRLQAMFADLPNVSARRASNDFKTATHVDDASNVPDYFKQDFHFQTDGYLSDRSARLYDVQVETLFYGAAAAMRRAVLRPLADALRGRDQRQLALADVACGTGRLLRDIRLTYPALNLSGVDLSAAYLREAERSFGRLRPAKWVHANAEEMPLVDQSQDVVTSVFLFHELPHDVRRRVASDIVRVLRPGGTIIVVDSLQLGDRPGWDGLLEAFPERFHEPYYREYTQDDLGSIFSAFGLQQITTSLAFFSKVVVAKK